MTFTKVTIIPQVRPEHVEALANAILALYEELPTARREALLSHAGAMVKVRRQMQPIVREVIDDIRSNKL